MTSKLARRTARRTLTLSILALTLAPLVAAASHIAGIRITETNVDNLDVDIDVTAFDSTSSTEASAYLGTYYNQVPAVDWGDGSTVPRYGYGSSTGIPLAATSTSVNGIPVRAYRGSFSHTYGAPGDYSITANTTCCPLSTPTYTLATGTIVTTTFVTATPFAPGGTTISTTFVRNSLGVSVSLPPGFSKDFSPNPVAAGATSTLSFTVDNSANPSAASSLAFTDTLPAGLVVATPANLANTCGGSLTAASGTDTSDLAGGSVAAGATCTVDVDVTAATPGDYINTSGALTSNHGDSGTAMATLTVVPAVGFTKTFSPDQVSPGEVSTLTFTVDNTAGTSAISGVTFTDDLPTGMIVATPANASDGCGGTLTAPDGASTITYSGGTVGAGATCTIDVDVTVTMTGSFANVVSDASSSVGPIGVGGAATATLSGGSVVDVPTTSGAGLALLAGLLALFAVLAIRRAT